MAGSGVEAFGERIMGYEVSSESTVDDYTTWVRRFETWKPEGDPDEEMLRDWDSFLADPDMEPTWENARGPSVPREYAYQTRIKALSAVKLWSRHEYDAPVGHEVQHMCQGEPAPFDPTVLSQSEVNDVINNADIACDNPDCHTAIRVGYDAIMRGAELANVRADDLDHDEKGLLVRSVKGSNQITVKLDPGVWRALSTHADTHPERDRLFYNSYGRPWKPDAINAHIRRKHCPEGSHSLFRHSAITNRLRRGEDFGQVFLMARHTSPQTTLRYVSVAGTDAPGWVG